MDLANSSAIVTGGASGLGGATARLLASRGVHVVVVDLNPELGAAMAAEIGGTFVAADVANADQVQEAVVAAVDAGPLRSVVNCAGIGMAMRTVARDGTPHDLSIYTKVLQVNLIGTFNVSRLAASAIGQHTPPLEDGERGAIVNTASVAGFEGQTGQVAYSSSKGGIIGLTLPLARDLSAMGVRVNTIAPGLMNTPLMNAASPEVIDGLNKSVLFPKRMGQPEEFAALAVHLLTNSYLNGETIRLDGGIRFQPK